MTAALDLLRRLTAAGVTLDLEDEDVRCRGPRATLTTQVLEELASCKAEIVVELQRWSAQEPCCPADVFEIIGARLPSHEADARALAEYGFASWAILAHAHRTHILAQIRGLAIPDHASEAGTSRMI